MSDTSDFESADEGTENVEKKDKKITKTLKTEAKKDNEDGWENDWDDFDVDESQNHSTDLNQVENKTNIMEANLKESSQADGWDNFDDWNDGSDKNISEEKQENRNSTLKEHTQKDFQALADRLSSLGKDSSVKEDSKGGWGGWSTWGVANMLTSGVSQLTSHVSQGFSSVSQAIESGIGVPDPTELAQLQKSTSKTEELQKSANVSDSPIENNDKVKVASDEVKNIENDPQTEDMLGVFKIGKLVSSVTKLVETTGSVVVTGGIDTLEEIGKRTMRVLQGEDEGKKRLSTLLREARQYTEQNPNTDETVNSNVKKKMPQFEALFDDFQGLVHLEALEMLSKQCDMKIHSLLNSFEGQELIELKETLEQVKEICDLPEPDEDDKYHDSDPSGTKFKTKLLESVKDMGIQLQFEPIVSCWIKIVSENNDTEEIVNTGDGDNDSQKTLVENAEKIMIKAITDIAQSSALSVQLLHRSTALLSVRERRSTADEADGLTQLTVVLTLHIGEIAAFYSHKLHEISQLSEDSPKINELITSIFLEAEKGSTYIKDAFALTIPILQVGAT